MRKILEPLSMETDLKIIFLVLFVVIFLSVIFYVFKPKGKKKQQSLSKLPLEDNEKSIIEGEKQ
jgi:cbb3-type cytochrome oxidase subunit 3